MSWETVILGDLCSVITKGTTPSNIGASFTDRGIKYIRSEMLTSAKYVTGDFLYISQETHERLKRSQLQTGDILFSMAGVYLGKTAILRAEDTPSNTNQAVALIRIDPNKCNNEYVYYYLNIPEVVKTANTVQSQSAQPNINLKQIGHLKIKLPDVDTQAKIVEILSAYDNLIESNQKQVKLLEEAAQRLYKEWFVDLRFPGYEDTPIIDGVPEGWSYKPLSDLFSFVRGKSYTSKELSDTSGVLMVNLKNIRAFGGYNRNAEKRFTGKYKDEQALNPGDLVMGVTDMTQERRLVGHTAIVPDLGEPMTFSMDLIKLVPLSIQKSYLYSSLYYGGYSFKISPLANGVNVLHLKPEAIMSLQMLVPTEELMDAYGKVFDPIQSRIELLQKQIDTATESRDRLLPKLMSGEIEV